MNQFWIDTMNYLLGDVLYHGNCKCDWCQQYEYEIECMIKDIKDFHAANVDAGLDISNDAMARFLVCTEYMHIGNSRAVKRSPVDEMELLAIAAHINDELN
nr:MAG TPA: hypothetical protein [Caudoviricetes sp.]